MLLPTKPIHNLQGACRVNNMANSQFIQKIREEDRRDKILEDVFKKSSAENPYLQKIAASIELCSAIKQEKHDRQNKDRRELLLYRDNHDLQKLAVQLRAAYISKTIAAQTFEVNALRCEKESNNHNTTVTLREFRYNNKEFEQKKLDFENRKKEEFKQGLQEQMARTEARRQKNKMKVLREREMMDAAVKQYEEDVKKEREECQKKKQKVRAEMEEYIESVKQWKIANALPGGKDCQLCKGGKSEEFEQKIAQHRLDRKNQREMKVKFSEEMGRRLDEAKKDKLKFHSNLIELLVDERNAKEEAKEQSFIDHKNRQREEINLDLIRYQEEKRRKKLELMMSKAEENRQMKQQMKDYHEQQEKAFEKRRQKILQYRNDLLGHLEQKKRFTTREMKALINEHIKDAEVQRRRDNEIQNCRKKMLLEHAPGLLGYMAPEILGPSDFEYLSLPSK